MKAEVSQIDRKIVQLAYEKRIGYLETERMVLRERTKKYGKPAKIYKETFEHSMMFLSNPWIF